MTSLNVADALKVGSSAVDKVYAGSVQVWPADSPAPTGYATEVLADAPLAYYRLGEASGATLADSSGNGHDGATTGTVSAAAPGLLVGDADLARDFGGGHGTVPDAEWMRPAALTAECWFKADNVSGDRPLVTRSNWATEDSNPSRSFHLMVRSGVLRAQVVTTGGYRERTIGAVTAGAIYHAALTYDGTVMRMYLNGVQVDESALAAAGVLNPAIGTPLGIGTDSAANFAKFDGVIDEVAFYGTALTAERIAAHYAAASA